MKARSKYNNIKTTIDDIKFDSKKEAKRYGELKLLERCGEITDLQLQPSYTFKLNETVICRYRADFSYKEKGLLIVEDCKGFKTAVYKIKRKLMKAFHDIDVFET